MISLALSIKAMITTRCMLVTSTEMLGWSQDSMKKNGKSDETLNPLYFVQEIHCGNKNLFNRHVTNVGQSGSNFMMDQNMTTELWKSVLWIWPSLNTAITHRTVWTKLLMDLIRQAKKLIGLYTLQQDTTPKIFGTMTLLKHLSIGNGTNKRRYNKRETERICFVDLN